MDIETILEMYEDDYNPSSTVPGPRNMYNQGQLVQPNTDGSRPGYNGKDAYAINRDKKRTEAKEKGKVYDLKTKRFRKSKVPVSQYGAGASSDMKEYMKQYYKDTKEYTESGKLQIERDKKLKEFIGNKKKIS